VPYHLCHESGGHSWRTKGGGARYTMILRGKRLPEPSRPIERAESIVEASGTPRLSLAALWYRDCSKSRHDARLLMLGRFRE